MLHLSTIVIDVEMFVVDLVIVISVQAELKIGVCV